MTVMIIADCCPRFPKTEKPNNEKPAVALMLAGIFALSACQSSSDPSVQAHNAEFGCIAGTVGGAIVGGLIGSTIGGGSGQVIGTAIGVGGGGFLGNRLACR